MEAWPWVEFGTNLRVIEGSSAVPFRIVGYMGVWGYEIGKGVHVVELQVASQHVALAGEASSW